MRLLEPHSVSAVLFKAREKLVPLHGIMFESSDARFVSIAADGHRVVVDGGFVLLTTNESDGPMTLDQAARFSVSVINDNADDVRVGGRHTDGDDEWFGTASSEHGATLVAAGLHFAAADDGGGDVRSGAAASCDA